MQGDCQPLHLQERGFSLGGGAVPRAEAPLLHLVGGTKHIMMHSSGRCNISVACLTALSKGIKSPSAMKAKIQTREMGDRNLEMFSEGEFSLTYKFSQVLFHIPQEMKFQTL